MHKPIEHWMDVASVACRSRSCIVAMIYQYLKPLQNDHRFPCILFSTLNQVRSEETAERWSKTCFHLIYVNEQSIASQAMITENPLEEILENAFETSKWLWLVVCRMQRKKVVNLDFEPNTHTCNDQFYIIRHTFSANGSNTAAHNSANDKASSHSTYAVYVDTHSILYLIVYGRVARVRST